MLQEWLKSDKEASWNNLIQAAENVGHHTLAAKIKQNVLKQDALTGIFLTVSVIMNTIATYVAKQASKI